MKIPVLGEIVFPLKTKVQFENASPLLEPVEKVCKARYVTTSVVSLDAPGRLNKVVTTYQAGPVFRQGPLIASRIYEGEAFSAVNAQGRKGKNPMS